MEERLDEDWIAWLRDRFIKRETCTTRGQSIPTVLFLISKPNMESRLLLTRILKTCTNPAVKFIRHGIEFPGDWMNAFLAFVISSGGEEREKKVTFYYYMKYSTRDFRIFVFRNFLFSRLGFLNSTFEEGETIFLCFIVSSMNSLEIHFESFLHIMHFASNND